MQPIYVVTKGRYTNAKGEPVSMTKDGLRISLDLPGVGVVWFDRDRVKRIVSPSNNWVKETLEMMGMFDE